MSDLHLFNVGELQKDSAGMVLQNLYKTMSRCYSPFGESTLVFTDDEMPTATKDGYSILTRLKGSTEEANFILNLVRNVSAHTLFSAGDGTTTAVLLTSKLYDAMLKYKNENFSNLTTVEFTNTVKAAIDWISVAISKVAVKPTKKQLLDVAYTSLNNDEMLTEVIKKALDLFEEDEDFSIIAKKNLEDHTTKIEQTDGLHIPITLEYGMSDIINTYENTRVLCIGHKVEAADQIEAINALISYVMEERTDENLLIIFPEISTWLSIEAKRAMQAKMAEGKRLNVFLSQYSRGGSLADKDVYDDAMAYIGTFPFACDEGLIPLLIGKKMYDNLSIVKMITNKSKTILKMVKRANEAEYDTRLSAIENLIKSTTGPDKSNAEYRLKRLKHKNVVIHVGASTAPERNRLFDSFEDATLAMYYANKDGIVSGMNTSIPKACDVVLADMEKENGIYHTSVKGIPTMLKEVYFELFDLIVKLSKRPIDSRALFDSVVSQGKSLNTWDIKFNKPSTAIVNSVTAEIAILRAAFEIVSVLITSNQLILGDAGLMNAYHRDAVRYNEAANE